MDSAISLFRQSNGCFGENVELFVPPFVCAKMSDKRDKGVQLCAVPTYLRCETYRYLVLKTRKVTQPRINYGLEVGPFGRDLPYR